MTSGPDVHVVILVRTERREHLIDVGYGAPFYEPLPRDSNVDQAVCFGGERYVLKPQDESGRSRVDHYRDGELIHGYVAKPTPREPGHFAEIIRVSYTDTAMFMNALRLIRFLDGRSVSISNESFIERTVEEIRITRLTSMNAVLETIEREFGMPGEIVRQATEGMDLAGLRAVNG